MIVVISPAKSLNFERDTPDWHTIPEFINESTQLITELKEKSVEDLKSLMNISDKIATLNHDRYQKFCIPFTLSNSKQSIFAFDGSVYKGIKIQNYDKETLDFTQKHLRILSGLYGLLRPLDLIQAYRLEMGVKLKNKLGKNLYEFWGDKLTASINSSMKSNKTDVLINLASQEYFKAINVEKLIGKVINIVFQEKRNDKYKIISFSAKKARGQMVNYILQNKVTNPAKIKVFNQDNYKFNKKLSNSQNWFFTR